MSIAPSLERYLNARGVSYDLMTHDRTLRSSETAESVGISEDNLAKGVLMKLNGGGFLLAIVPASHHVELEEVGAWLNRPVALATEEEVAALFQDCETGAVPPIAGAYGLSAIMDDNLESFNDIYFEGGDHRTLVHLNGREFHRLMILVPHANISVRNH